MSVSFSASAGRSKYQTYSEDGALAWTGSFIDTRDSWTGMFWSRGGFLKGINASMNWEKSGVYVDDFTRVEPGRRLRYEGSLTLRPRSDVEVEVGSEYVRQTVDRTGDVVFSGLTYKTGLHYQITRSLFLSGTLHGETRDDQYGIDVVAGYYFGAGKGLLANKGSNNCLHTSPYGGPTGSACCLCSFPAPNLFQVAYKDGSRLEEDLRQQGYSVAAKVSYLLRM